MARTTVKVEETKVEETVVEAPPRAARKLAWKFPEGFDRRGITGQMATLNGNSYAILPVLGETGEIVAWNALHHLEGDENPTLLVEGGSHGQAYRACANHHNKNYRAPAVVEEAAQPESA